MSRAKSLGLVILAGISPIGLSAGERCAAPAPNTCAPGQSNLYNLQQLQQAGVYTQPPATGDITGETSGSGIQGLRIRFPEVNLQLPTVQFPAPFRYKRGPQMNVDAATAPFVTGGPLPQFGMLAGGQPAPANLTAPNLQNLMSPQPNLTAPYQPIVPCDPVPPCPAGASLERQQLLEELSRKEAELQQMQERFGRLEAAVNRLAASRQPIAPEGIEQTHYEQSRVASEVSPPPSRPLGMPATGGQKRSGSTTKPAIPVTTQSIPARMAIPATAGLSKPESRSSAGEFGEWSGRTPAAPQPLR